MDDDKAVKQSIVVPNRAKIGEMKRKGTQGNVAFLKATCKRSPLTCKEREKDRKNEVAKSLSSIAIHKCFKIYYSFFNNLISFLFLIYIYFAM